MQTTCEGDRPISPILALKLVNMATSLERSEKVRLIIYDQMRPYDENSVKIGPVDFEIICLKGSLKIKLEIILTLLRQIGIPPPTVAPWREALYKDRQLNRRVGVF